MLSLKTVFIVVVALTVASGAAASSIVMFGDTRRNSGQRTVAERLSQIAFLGAVAIISLLTIP